MFPHRLQAQFRKLTQHYNTKTIEQSPTVLINICAIMVNTLTTSCKMKVRGEKHASSYTGSQIYRKLLLNTVITNQIETHALIYREECVCGGRSNRGVIKV